MMVPDGLHSNLVCAACGEPYEGQVVCNNCGNSEWTDALFGDSMAKVFLQVGSQEAERDADGYYVFPIPKEGLKLYLQKADGSSTLRPSDSYICVTVNRNCTVETGRT